MSIKLKHSGGNSVSLNPPTSAPTSSEVAFKLPNADGSANQLLKTDGSGNLGFVAQGVAGITEFDYWYLSSSTGNGVNADITSGLLRNNHAAAPSQIGTGMTESSGIFTFPSTGIYYIHAFVLFQGSSANYYNLAFYTTVDNSTYTQAVDTYTFTQDDNDYAHTSGTFIFDVTNTTTHKMKFGHRSASGGGSLQGATGDSSNAFTFMKLGDT